VIRRANQVLLSFLRVQVIVNNKEIYPLLNDKPVLIEADNNLIKIVVSDGFHFTKPIELKYSQPSYYHFKIVSPVNDLQLLGGAFVMFFFYLLGFITGILLMKLLSFAPIILLLIIYYLNRKSFIHVRQDDLTIVHDCQRR
jgi:hypothetical protein